MLMFVIPSRVFLNVIHLKSQFSKCFTLNSNFSRDHQPSNPYKRMTAYTSLQQQTLLMRTCFAHSRKLPNHKTNSTKVFLAIKKNMFTKNHYNLTSPSRIKCGKNIQGYANQLKYHLTTCQNTIDILQIIQIFTV